MLKGAGSAATNCAVLRRRVAKSFEDRGAVVVDQLREKLIKIGAKAVSHGRYVTSSQFRRPALINILWLAGAK